MKRDDIMTGLSLALNRSISIGQSLDALVRLREESNYEEVVAAVKNGPTPVQATPKPTMPNPNFPAFKDPELRFGKYRGQHVSAIAKSDAQYLLWVIDQNDAAGAWFKEQCRLALEIYDSVDGPPKNSRTPKPARQSEFDINEDQPPPAPSLPVEEDDVPF